MDATTRLDDAGRLPDSDLRETAKHDGPSNGSDRGRMPILQVAPAKFRIIVYHGMFAHISWRDQTWQKL
jgi:hypothetical protein